MSKYTKADLVRNLSTCKEIKANTINNMSNVVECLIADIIKHTTAGEQVDIFGLCTFKPSIQKAKTGKIPGTDKTYSSPERKIVKITPVKAFKDSVANG